MLNWTLSKLNHNKGNENSFSRQHVCSLKKTKWFSALKFVPNLCLEFIAFTWQVRVRANELPRYFKNLFINTEARALLGVMLIDLPLWSSVLFRGASDGTNKFIRLRSIPGKGRRRRHEIPFVVWFVAYFLFNSRTEQPTLMYHSVKIAKKYDWYPTSDLSKITVLYLTKVLCLNP